MPVDNLPWTIIDVRQHQQGSNLVKRVSRTVSAGRSMATTEDWGRIYRQFAVAGLFRSRRQSSDTGVGR
jgi:hypothetical protein